MEMSKKNLLTSSEVTAILIGSTIGIGVISLPTSLAKIAYQNAWIAAALGSIYPIYLALLLNFIAKKFPKENILVLSKKYLGDFFGNMLNILLGSFFLFYLIFTVSGFSNLFNVYGSKFISPLKLITLTTFTAAFTAFKGIKTISKIDQIVFYIMIILIFSCAAAFTKGNIENVLPITQINLLELLSAVKESSFSYAGIEIIFLIYPFVKDRERVKKCLLKYILITIFIYTFVVFITIFYLGPELAPKSLWSFTLVSESLNLPIINSFRFIFVFSWISIVFRLSSHYYYGAAFILNDIFKRFKRIHIFILIYPISISCSMLMTNEASRRSILNKLVPYYTLFSITYFSIIALFIFLKRNDKLEKA